MADRADFYVKNAVTGDIRINRLLPDGSSDLDIAIANGAEEIVHLPGPEVSLRISAPEGIDIREHPFKVKSDVDLAVSHSRSGSTWTLKIDANDLPPDAPTTVNVSVGEPEPD